MVALNDTQFVLAERMLEKHSFDRRLRALDAIQLAAASELRNNVVVDGFVAADKAICGVAAKEGFPVVNPEESF